MTRDKENRVEKSWNDLKEEDIIKLTKLTRKTKYSFALGGMGYHLYVGIIMMYLTIFYTDVVGISGAAVGTLFLVARLWDAINDPIMGMIVDKTPYGKIGKFKKYLLLTPAPLALFFVLCFLNPALSMSGKVVYAYITYIMYGMLYTVYEVPYWGFSSNITYVATERNSLISVTKLFQLIGVYVPIIAGLPLVAALGKGNANKGWFLTALLLGILGFICTLLPGLTIKENKQKYESKKSGLKEFGQLIRNNTPIKVLIIANVFLGITLIGSSLNIYFWTYNLNRPDLYPIFMIGGAIVSIFGSALVPKVIQLTGDKTRALMMVTIMGIVLNIVSYLVGYNNLIIFVVLRLLDTLLVVVFPLVIIQIMFADCIEYNEWKTGVRNEGTIFALKSFVEKLKMTISGAAAAYILSIIGYVPLQAQSQSTLSVLFIASILVPAAGLLMFLIAMKFYPLTDKKYDEIILELKDRR